MSLYIYSSDAANTGLLLPIPWNANMLIVQSVPWYISKYHRCDILLWLSTYIICTWPSSHLCPVHLIVMQRHCLWYQRDADEMLWRCVLENRVLCVWCRKRIWEEERGGVLRLRSCVWLERPFSVSKSPVSLPHLPAQHTYTKDLHTNTQRLFQEEHC